ncbi:hypothetical protein FLL45_20335 [Aliikangiella marina]|uniref:Uncharacterized protein n=1 Tax=Aliikangiella marina TaxID=1712262 RepID=A0A545T2Q2_9GAMM|nr:hypothetical protein [Aliikangiella marina]TQV71503.1 hypothetical protein FLL45_20335 [Aliikangiella marina]
MNAIEHFHAVTIRTPHYGDQAGAQIHRYLVPEFVQQFENDLNKNRLDSADLSVWQEKDRFSKHDDNVVLRLPMHKTFYLVSCEVACQRLGLPALDEEKITSAGFVIRRLSNGREFSWMIDEDEAIGWEETATGFRDPDVHRRMCRDGTLHPREDVATYTGEKTHPMHPKKAFDKSGKRRTVLYGYIPLGGSFVPRRESGVSSFESDSMNEFKAAAAQHLSWPYGLKDSGSKQWKSRFTQPVEQGQASKEFFELLRLLINRYHLGESDIDENEALTELAKSIYFYSHDDLMKSSFNDYTKGNYENTKKYSLFGWMESHFQSDDNGIVAWMSRQEKLIEAFGELSTDFEFEKLPAKDNKGLLNFSLYITASEAREFRTLLEQRVIANAEALAQEVPIPKFGQTKEDVYQIVPFVRALDDHDKERIYWADSTTKTQFFRVAAPFDAKATRPSMIQMPSLSDLKNGMAKGASMITPPDTFNLLNALNLKKGASEDVLPADEPSGIGIQWICSFSLPVITLVAMIILMIMISLLNIIFFWLPWVKICLPFPKFK